MNRVSIIMPKQKVIALIAHDNLKDRMVEWCRKNKSILEGHFLCGTGTTATLIAKHTGLPVRAYESGPVGGDMQIGSRIVEGKIDMVIFFSDPLSAHPHDTDVKALLRIAQVCDVPIANNEATADFLITSEYMNSEYPRTIMSLK